MLYLEQNVADKVERQAGEVFLAGHIQVDQETLDPRVADCRIIRVSYVTSKLALAPRHEHEDY